MVHREVMSLSVLNEKKLANHQENEAVVNFKQSYLAMIRAFPGGWDAIVGALGMSRDALENRIYERKGQGVAVDLAMLMQTFSATTHFAEAVATASGGTFVKLPDDLSCANECMMAKSHTLYIELGQYFKDIREATADDVIDKGERLVLDASAARVHKVMGELHALTLRLYTPQAPGSDQ